MNAPTFQRDIWPIRHKLYRFALRIVQNQTEAEDVVQEVMAKLWNRRAQWAEINNLEAWSMRLTRNLAIDYVRRRRVRRTETTEDLVGLAGGERTPLEHTEQHDIVDHLRLLVKDLPVNYRLVWHLREVEQLSYQEICDRLEMPMNQVKTNLFRARNKLKEALLKHENYGLSNR